MFEGTDTMNETLVEPKKTLTRRSMLKAAAMGSIALAGGAALVACGSSGSGTGTPTTVNVTFLTAGYQQPFGPPAFQPGKFRR